MNSKEREILNFTIYKTNLLLKGQLHIFLREFQLTTEQWFLIKCISENSGVNQKELSELAYKEQAVITRLLDLLEKKDLVERKKSIEDKREYLIYLTESGNQMYQSTLPVIGKYRTWLASKFDEQDMEDLSMLLHKLNDNIREERES